MTDPSSIIAGLSEAQKRAILTQSCTGAGMWSVRNALARKGLFRSMPFRITDFGLAVRAALLSQDKSNG